MEIVRELCSFEGRLAGTDAERRAANRLAERLRSAGRRVEVEPVYVHPQYALVHAAHCLLGFAGSLAAIALPALGFGLVLLAATSMYLDLNYRLYLLRTLFFRRASQNVVSPGGDPRRSHRLILCAHYDTARGGAAFAPGRTRLAHRIGDRLSLPVGRFRPLFWSLAALLPLLGARMAGVESNAIGVLQLIPTLILLVGLFALLDIALSNPVPGANDNASGVAAVLSLAETLDREPPQHLDVWILLTSAAESLQEGTKAFVRARRDELVDDQAIFLCLETVGAGDVRFETGGGWAVSYAMDARLIELAQAIADADRERANRYRARPLRHGEATDSVPARIVGLRAMTIGCRAADGTAPHSHRASDTPENIDPGALDRAHEFALELIRALDRDLGRERRVH